MSSAPKHPRWRCCKNVTLQGMGRQDLPTLQGTQKSRMGRGQHTPCAHVTAAFFADGTFGAVDMRRYTHADGTVEHVAVKRLKKAALTEQVRIMQRWPFCA